MNDSKSREVKEWYPDHIISGEDPFVLLVLNQPLNEENKLFIKKHWKSASLRIAVDGGANQLKELSDKSFSYIPELVCGDFDSATLEVLDFYRQKGSKVVHTPDQDETDFTKALRLTKEYLNDHKMQVSSIVTVVRNGNRLDHIIGNLNTLYLADDIVTAPVFILGDNSLTWLLSVGNHKIHVTDKMMDSKVGLIPLGSECSDVSTTGLQWNMEHGKMRFGGLISICNMFDGSNIVTVSTNSPLIWTMEMKSEIH